MVTVPFQVLVSMGWLWSPWKDMELSAKGVTRVSRNGMAPFA